MTRLWTISTALLSATVFTIIACSARERAGQASTPQPQASASGDWKAVEQAIGRSGAMQPGDVFKFGMPRSDMHVTVKGVEGPLAGSTRDRLAIKSGAMYSTVDLDVESVLVCRQFDLWD